VAGFKKQDAEKVARATRIVLAPSFDHGSPNYSGQRSGMVKPFTLSEDLETAGSAEAVLRINNDDSPGELLDAPTPDDPIIVFAGDMPTGKKLPSGTHIFAVYYGAWYVLSAWGCLEDIE
jgi:hypothetical protein